MDKLLVTPAEAARLLSVGRSKVYLLLASGELDSVHIGSSRRIPVASLRRFVEDLGAAGSIGVDDRSSARSA